MFAIGASKRGPRSHRLSVASARRPLAGAASRPRDLAVSVIRASFLDSRVDVERPPDPRQRLETVFSPVVRRSRPHRAGSPHEEQPRRPQAASEKTASRRQLLPKGPLERVPVLERPRDEVDPQSAVVGMLGAVVVELPDRLVGAHGRDHVALEDPGLAVGVRDGDGEGERLAVDLDVLRRDAVGRREPDRDALVVLRPRVGALEPARGGWGGRPGWCRRRRSITRRPGGQSFVARRRRRRAGRAERVARPEGARLLGERHLDARLLVVARRREPAAAQRPARR
mmetsp:Transcript_25963/g.103812  ORF Transcript_25963/g.103812 Transcript_25963/m.103812 type:complete len:284 (+) Transcript_25963:704-1555(+)